MEASPNVMRIMKRAKGRAGSLLDAFETGGWRAHFRDIARYCLNRRGEYLESRDYDPNHGGRINQAINNGMPEESIHTVASGMMNSVSNPALPWIQVTPEDEDLKDDKTIQDHVWRQLRTLYSLINDSNVYDTMPQWYAEAAAFGTAAFRLDPHPTNTFKATHLPIGSFQLANGGDGTPDTCLYRYARTVRQLVELYGINAVSRATREKYNADSGAERDHFVKCSNLIEPNVDRDRNFLDWRGMRFRSITWEDGVGDNEPPLKIGGMHMFPIVTIITGAVGEQVYGGYARGMRVLPESRQLQKEEEQLAKGTGKMISPPLNVPHALRRADGRMNGINRYRGQRSDAIRPTFQVQFPYQEMKDTTRDRERKIQEISGASVFRTFSILDQTGNHNMTIPEVQERRAEAASLLGPLLRSVNTSLRHMVEVMWDYAERDRKFEEPPEVLQGLKLRVDFVNQLSLEQASALTNAAMGYANAMATLDQSFPGRAPASDNLDLDLLATEMRQGFFVNPKLQVDPRQRDEGRQQRAQQAEEQAAQERQQEEAKTAQTLSNTPLSDGTTALDAVSGV